MHEANLLLNILKVVALGIIANFWIEKSTTKKVWNHESDQQGIQAVFMAMGQNPGPNTLKFSLGFEWMFIHVHPPKLCKFIGFDWF